MESLNNILSNSKNIKSITDFTNYVGKNGTFARVIGEDGRLNDEIARMDTELSRLSVTGACIYKRIGMLPNITSPDDVSFYTESYNDWIRSGRRRVSSKYTAGGNISSELSLAVCEVVRQLRILKPTLTDSIEKNAVIKLLFRYDGVMRDFGGRGSTPAGAKLAADNITKEQDYLFFYMLAILGMNVLIIQNRSDIDMYQKQLNLSAGTVIGHMGNSAVPEYTERTAVRPEPAQSVRTAPPTVRTQPTVRMTIPPRPQKNRAAESVRVQTPYSPALGSPSQIRQQGQSVRVTVPPHPNRQNTGIRSSSVNTQPRTSVITPSVPPVRSDPSGYRGSYSSVVTGTYPNAAADTARRELSYEQIARLASSIVQILVYSGAAGPNIEPDAGGSGIMIGTRGYVLTNCHVVDRGRTYGVRMENDPNIYCTDRLIKYHRDLDLAVLKIDRPLQPLRVYSGSQGLVRGQRVVAIGSPLGMFNTVSDGIISGFRNIDGINMIQFTAPISHGSSGGAVLNMYGEVIGISTAGLKDGQNINLAVPYDAINAFCRSFL